MVPRQFSTDTAATSPRPGDDSRGGDATAENGGASDDASSQETPVPAAPPPPASSGKALWSFVKKSVESDISSGTFRREPLAIDRSSRQGQQRNRFGRSVVVGGMTRAGGGGGGGYAGGGRAASSSSTCSLPEDLCEEFRTCPSLAPLRRALNSALAEDKKVCSVVGDPSTGMLPLHCIGLNRDLIIGSTGGSAAGVARIDEFILQEVLPSNPSAIVTEDNAGLVPFTETIVKWIRARRAARKLAATQRGRKRDGVPTVMGKSMKMIKRLSDHLLDVRSDDNEDDDDHAVAGMNRSQSSIDFYRSDILDAADADDNKARRKSRISFSILNFEEESDDNESDEEDEDEDEVHDLPPMVEWSLRMLSAIVELPMADVDQLGCSASSKRTSFINDSTSSMGSSESMSGSSSMQQSRKLRKLQQTLSLVAFDEVLVEKVAGIPHLVEELLLIEDKAARTRVFDLPFVHKVLFSERSLGDGKWFMDMLTRGVERQDGDNNAAKNGSQMSLTGCGGAPGGGRSSSRRISTLGSTGLEQDSSVDADAAVFYLEAISNLSLTDDLHVFHSVMSQKEGAAAGNHHHPKFAHSDLRHFKRKRNRLYDAIAGLAGLIRTICVLDGDLMSRAASTPVIRRMLDKKMFSPFAMTQALYNGTVNFAIVVTFRLGPGPAMLHLSPADTWFDAQTYLVSNMLLMACVLYCLKTEIQVAIAKYTLSPRLFWSDSFTFWKFLDVVPLFMVIFCVVAVDYTLRQNSMHEMVVEQEPEVVIPFHMRLLRLMAPKEEEEVQQVTEVDIETPFYLRAAVVLTTPLLWLRILGHFKMWNLQLATFILSSVEIMKEIKWFLVVLLVTMASFSQMFVSLSYEPSRDMHYQSFSLQGYMKAYTMMLGDFDSISMKSHPSLAVLFVIYTFGVTVVLLNILIAIVSDAYTSSTVSSKKMLAKARIMFVSEMSSFNQFHKMKRNGKFGSLGIKMNACLFGFAAVLTQLLVWTVEAKDKRVESSALPLAARTYALLLFVALGGIVWLMRSTMVDTLLATWCPNGKVLTPAAKAEWMKRYYTGQLYDLFRNGIDFLQDNDSKILLESSAANETHDSKSEAKIAKQQIFKMQKALAVSKKELKAEIKHTAEQLNTKLQETEVHSSDRMAKLEERLISMTDMIAALDERLMRTISVLEPQIGSLSEPSKAKNDERLAHLRMNAQTRNQ